MFLFFWTWFTNKDAFQYSTITVNLLKWYTWKYNCFLNCILWIYNNNIGFWISTFKTRRSHSHFIYVRLNCTNLKVLWVFAQWTWLASALGVYLLFFLYQRDENEPNPGPKPLPLLGNLLMSTNVRYVLMGSVLLTNRFVSIGSWVENLKVLTNWPNEFLQRTILFFTVRIWPFTYK